MNILFLLVPFALILGCTFLFCFLWASRAGQFDDLDTPALRMMSEEDKGVTHE